MRFINKDAVDAKFFKSHDVVFATLIVELFQLRFGALLRLFQLLDREVIPTVALDLRNSGNDFFNLLLEQPYSTGCGNR